MACLTGGLRAQELPQDEISVYLLGGFTQLRHGSAFSSEGNFGGGGGASYASPISRYWDVVGGLELLYYHSAAKADSLYGSAEGIYTGNGRIEPMYFQSAVAGYAEQEHITYLQVPLMIRFKTPVAGDHKFYIAAGVKAGYSIITHYSSAITTMETSIYLPDVEQYLRAPIMRGHGVGTYANETSKGSSSFKTGNVSVAVEAGMRWRVSRGISLYTGLFLDYGLWETGPRQSETDLPLVTYDETSNTLLYNSMLSSKNQEQNKAYVDKLGLLAAGLKVSLAFTGLY